MVANFKSSFCYKTRRRATWSAILRNDRRAIPVSIRRDVYYVAIAAGAIFARDANKSFGMTMREFNINCDSIFHSSIVSVALIMLFAIARLFVCRPGPSRNFHGSSRGKLDAERAPPIKKLNFTAS